MAKEYKYQIGKITYIQRPLVLGQLPRFMSSLNGVVLNGTTPLQLIDALGEHLPRAMACVLLPQGQSVKDVDVEALTEEMEECPLEVAIQVVSDFFDCNPIASVLEKLAGMASKIAEPKIGSKKSVAS